MADKPTQLILDALERAVADPPDVPLFAVKGTPGLFPATAAARPAAQRCKDEGYLRPVRTETRGKTVREFWAITEKGLNYLLQQVSPRQVLEDFVRVLEARQVQVNELLGTARHMQQGLDGLKSAAEQVLPLLARTENRARPPAPPPSPEPSPAADPRPELLRQLTRWADSPPGAAQDCPLPELYRRLRIARPDLSIGQFHDSLRHLHDREEVYLHPWTGPLYDLPEPALALLCGHEIAYYASPRNSEFGIRNSEFGRAPAPALAVVGESGDDTSPVFFPNSEFRIPNS